MATGACATVNPVLAPARVLERGRLATDVGTAYVAPVVSPALSDAQRAAADLHAGSDTPQGRQALLQGAAAFAPTAPGVAGYLAARLGFGHEIEGSVALAGRTARVGVRRVMWSDPERVWGLSLGAQVRGALWPVAVDGAVQGVSVDDSHVLGADVQAVLGRTSSDLYDIWIAARAGYLHADANLNVASSPMVTGRYAAHSERIEGAVTLGLRVGFGRVAALAEIEGSVAYVTAAVTSPVTVSGGVGVFALTPAAALSYAF